MTVKIRVHRHDGRIETLQFGPGSALTVQEGDTEDRIVGASGMHFFSKQGHYLGWGLDVSEAGVTSAEANEIADRVQAARIVDDGK